MLPSTPRSPKALDGDFILPEYLKTNLFRLPILLTSTYIYMMNIVPPNGP